jgi:hypothetical protein
MPSARFFVLSKAKNDSVLSFPASGNPSNSSPPACEIACSESLGKVFHPHLLFGPVPD